MSPEPSAEAGAKIATIDAWKTANPAADQSVADSVRGKAVLLQGKATAIATSASNAATVAALRDGETDGFVSNIQSADNLRNPNNEADAVAAKASAVSAASTAAAARNQATIAQQQANAAGQVVADANALDSAFAGWKSQVDQQAQLVAEQVAAQAAAAADAGNDTATMAEDGSVTINVLANDLRADGAQLNSGKIVAIGSATSGTVSLSADGVSVVDKPNANFHGTDSFTYTITNTVVINGQTRVTTDTATVNVTINSVNDVSVLTADVGTAANAATPVAIDVLSNDSDVDGDTLSISSVTQGAKGTVTITSGKVTYAPTESQFQSLRAGQTGTDTFTYTVSDGHGGSQTAAVTLEAIGDQSR